MKLTIESDKGEEILVVESDGQAHYIVRGKVLRDNVKEYGTDDDLHVLGLVNLILGSYNSREYLTRRLKEHEEA